MTIRTLADLTEVPTPAWPDLKAAIDSARAPVQLLEAEPSRAADTLYSLQVSAGSTLGALALHSGGLLIDGGWVRILGGGTDLLPSLASASGLGDPATADGPPPFLIVAYDILGGRFAVDGGGLGLAPGEVCYWAPESLDWEPLGLGHTDFVHAFLGGATTQFYATWRWPGWEAEVAALGLDQGLSVMPPPFTAEGREIEQASRAPVPFTQLLHFYDAMAAQLVNQAPGEQFTLGVTE